MTVEIARKLFTVDEYHRMAETGILGPEARVELVGGEIIEMSPIGVRHASCVKRLNRFFSRRVGTRATVSVQDPIRIGDASEPQPDLALLVPREDAYEEHHPTPEDAFLVVEVADTTLDYDRSVKLPMYQKAQIREVWIVDLYGERIEVYRRSRVGRYRRHIHIRGEALAPAAFPDVEIAVAEILGPQHDSGHA